MPGLIAGAHEGKSAWVTASSAISERCAVVLLHLVDGDGLEDIGRRLATTIRNELKAYGAWLGGQGRPVVALNKIDALDDPRTAAAHATR